MEFTGKLIKKTKEVSGVSKRTGNEWRTAEFLVVKDGRFKQIGIFQVRDTKEGRIAFFEKHIGLEVTVSFDLAGHEYNGNWYNQLDAWGIAPAAKATGTVTNTAGTVTHAVGTVPVEGKEFQDNNGEPLPFV